MTVVKCCGGVLGVISKLLLLEIFIITELGQLFLGQSQLPTFAVDRICDMWYVICGM